MFTKTFLRHPLARFCLILLLSLLIGLLIQIMPPDQVTAQSDSAIRSELVSLRSRLERLETEVRRLSPSGSRSNQPNQRNSPRENTAAASSDPMFDRLATLVIELKERVTALEKRMTQVEQKTATLNRSS